MNNYKVIDKDMRFEIVCECGNRSWQDGFETVLSDGTIVEPTLESGWIDLLMCNGCSQIYRQGN